MVLSGAGEIAGDEGMKAQKIVGRYRRQNEPLAFGFARGNLATPCGRGNQEADLESQRALDKVMSTAGSAGRVIRKKAPTVASGAARAATGLAKTKAGKRALTAGGAGLAIGWAVPLIPVIGTGIVCAAGAVLWGVLNDRE